MSYVYISRERKQILFTIYHFCKPMLTLKMATKMEVEGGGEDVKRKKCEAKLPGPDTAAYVDIHGQSMK